LLHQIWVETYNRFIINYPGLKAGAKKFASDEGFSPKFKELKKIKIKNIIG
jgi:hypothetical protein